MNLGWEGDDQVVIVFVRVHETEIPTEVENACLWLGCSVALPCNTERKADEIGGGLTWRGFPGQVYITIRPVIDKIHSSCASHCDVINARICFLASNESCLDDIQETLEAAIREALYALNTS